MTNLDLVPQQTQPIWLGITRVLLFISGLAIIGLPHFTYEDEQSKLQSRLEQWWIKLDDYRGNAFYRELNIVSRLSATVSQLLDGFFGESFITVRALLVSTSVSVLGACLVFIFPLITNWGKESPHGNAEFLIFMSVVAGWAILTIQGARHRPRTTLTVWLSIIFMICYLNWLIPVNGARSISRVLLMLGALTVSFATDLLLIATIRWLLRKAVFLKLWTALAVDLATLALSSGALALTPLLAAAGKHSALGTLGAWLIYLDGADGLMLLIIFVMAACTALHHTAWPVAQRSIYALQKNGFFSNKAMARSSGIVLITISFALGPSRMPVLAILKKLLGI